MKEKIYTKEEVLKLISESGRFICDYCTHQKWCEALIEHGCSDYCLGDIGFSPVTLYMIHVESGSHHVLKVPKRKLIGRPVDYEKEAIVLSHVSEFPRDAYRTIASKCELNMGTVRNILRRHGLSTYRERKEFAGKADNLLQ